VVSPKYNVDDIICFKESAAIGFLEHAYITSIRHDNSGGWIYSVSSSKRGPARTSSSQPLYFIESELILLCEALTLIVSILQSRLEDIETRLSNFCDSETEDVISGDGPKWNINDTVYLQESAQNGFLEAFRIIDVINNNNQWVYSISSCHWGMHSGSTYGDRIYSTYGRGHIHTSHGSSLYFTGDEFISLCEALLLAKSNLLSRISYIEARISALCV
jgi:hypothetical protein